jgi:EmrB/QacA subfamily drug resistance transporter
VDSSVAIGADLQPAQARRVLAVVALGTMMVSLDGTVVLLAQPALTEDLDASLAQVQWVTNAYLLAVGSLLIISGGVGDRIGNRRTFVIGVIGFAVTSGLIASVQDVYWLIGLRVLQGISGAILQPATLGMLRETFPDNRLDMPIAVRSAAIGVSTAAGPVVGGLLVEHAGWRAVFLINVPLGLMTLAIGGLVWRGRGTGAVRPPRFTGFDFLGAAVLAILLFVVFFGVSTITHNGVLDPLSAVQLIAMIMLGWLFIRIEKWARAPLVPLVLLRSPTLGIALLLVVCLSFAMIGTLFVVSYYALNQLGLDPVAGGIHVLPLTATLIVAAPLSGVAMRHVGARTMVGGGLLLTALSVYGLSRMGAAASSAELSLLLFGLGLGLSPALIGSTKIVLSSVPPGWGGLAGGLHQTAMQIGSGIGIAVMGTMLGSRAEQLLRVTLARSGYADPGASFAVQALADVSVGLHRPIAAMPAQLAVTWDALSTSIFMDAMSYALLAGVLAALLGVIGTLLSADGVRARLRRAVLRDGR